MSEQFAVCYCAHCNGGIEFDMANYQDGLTIECPHCHKLTGLRVNSSRKFAKILKPTKGALAVIAAMFAMIVLGKVCVRVTG